MIGDVEFGEIEADATLESDGRTFNEVSNGA